MTLKETIAASVTEFDEKPIISPWIFDSYNQEQKKHFFEQMKDVKSHLLASQHKLLDAVIEWAEKNKTFIVGAGGDMIYPDDLIDYLRSAKD